MEETAKIKWIVDGIAVPENFLDLQSVDLWHDRTVLHFLVEDSQQKRYLNKLNTLAPKGGFVIIAVFSLDGAKKCSGLDVKNYDHKMIAKFLGNDFKLLKYFPNLYKMSSGDLRPYIYTLFQKKD